MEEPKAVWQEGSTRLLDYGGKGPLALFVPSLINRAYILDLDKQRSILRWLKVQGLHPLLLDWGSPGADEKAYDLNSYTERLLRAMAQYKQPLHLVGYCMGGNIALAAAAQAQNRLSSLVLMATPWDFHAENKAAALRSAAMYRLWKPGCGAMGELPVDLIQTLFALLDPLGPQTKFMRFADMNDAQDVESFVALEDWLNDGIPLTLGVADTCLFDWYERNALVAGEWIDPNVIELPTDRKSVV